MTHYPNPNPCELIIIYLKNKMNYFEEVGVGWETRIEIYIFEFVIKPIAKLILPDSMGLNISNGSH